MEEDQVKHIKKNIDRLTNLTTCNVSVITALQAKEMLSKVETQQLEIKSKTEGDLSAAHKFYDIMMGKKDSYDFLIKVLNDACLSGAATILEEISPEQSSGATEKGKLDEQSSPKMEKAKSKKDLETLTIGTEDCDVHIDRIKDIVSASDGIQSVLQDGKWKSIATKLGISYTDKDKWSKEITLGTSSLLDVFERILIRWSSKKGREATVGILMKTVENFEMKSFSDKMKEAFE